MDTREKIKKILQYFEDKRQELENNFPNIQDYSIDIIDRYNKDYIQISKNRELYILNLKEKFHELDTKSFNRIFDTHNMLSQGWRLSTFTNPLWFLHITQQQSIDALNDLMNKLYNN
jgi:hypothetical protein